MLAHTNIQSTKQQTKTQARTNKKTTNNKQKQTKTKSWSQQKGLYNALLAGERKNSDSLK